MTYKMEYRIKTHKQGKKKKDKYSIEVKNNHIENFFDTKGMSSSETIGAIGAFGVVIGGFSLILLAAKVVSFTTLLLTYGLAITITYLVSMFVTDKGDEDFNRLADESYNTMYLSSRDQARRYMSSQDYTVITEVK